MKPKSIESFIESRRSWLMGQSGYYKCSTQEVEERIEILETLLKEKVEKYGLLTEVIQILMNTCTDFQQALFCSKKVEPEYETRAKAALTGIKAILHLNDSCGKRGQTSRMEFLSELDVEHIKEVESKIKERMKLLGDISQMFAMTLRAKDSDKYTMRQFLTPYEKQVDILLENKGMKPMARYDLIASLFYGCGLENDYTTGEIRKYLPSASTETLLDKMKL